MRLAILDTNVIVSAGIKPGSAPAQLVMDWVLEGRIHLVTSARVIREYQEVVRRPKFRRYGFPPQWLDFLIDESLQLPDGRATEESCPDPEDSHFLALARLAGAWLVTGNIKHFPERSRNGVTVLAPTDYLAHLNGE